jgi:hypothetical protein
VSEALPGKLLCIYISEGDRYHHGSLANAITQFAHEQGAAGATVVRGIEGFGHSGRLETNRLVSSSDNLPIIIEILDEEHRIDSLLPSIKAMVGEGLITVEDVELHSGYGDSRNGD